MFFPLLEALLQKNPELCKQRIHDFIQSEDDSSLLFKSMFTYAAQHSLAENPEVDAMVFVDCLANVFYRHQHSLSPGQQETLLWHGTNLLCSIPVESIDSGIFKPSHKANVVSIHDVEESFEQDDVNNVFISVRDLLALMDNKHYFMEIMYQIALQRSPGSIILASATSRAIEILDWKNNFTPFLVHHLIRRLFGDKKKHIFPDGDSNESNMFENCAARIHSVDDVQLLAAALYMHNDCKILATKIKAKVRMQLFSHFRFKEPTVEFPIGSISMTERILSLSGIADLESVNGIQLLSAKIPFVV